MIGNGWLRTAITIVGVSKEGKRSDVGSQGSRTGRAFEIEPGPAVSICLHAHAPLPKKEAATSASQSIHLPESEHVINQTQAQHSQTRISMLEVRSESTNVLSPKQVMHLAELSEPRIDAVHDGRTASHYRHL